MRLLFLTRSLVRGGAERQLVTLAKGLAARGHQVAIACFYPAEGLADELAASGVRLRICGKGGRWDVARFLGRLVTIVREEQPEILHSYMPIANIVAMTLKPLFPRIKIVWGVRASANEFAGYDWLLRATYTIEARWAWLPSLVIANSEAGARDAESAGFPAATLRVVANGIDSERFRHDDAGRTRLREEWRVARDAPLVGVIGRLDPMKDQASFLEAGRMIADRFDAIRLVLVGDGPAVVRDELAALASRLGLSDRLIWSRARDDMPAVLSALDVLVSSSAFGEGFSNVLAEALACGTPVVATDVGDAAVVVGSWGVLVPPRDAAALADAIGRVLSIPSDERAGRADAARRHVVDNFSVERLVDATERLLAPLAGRA
jgi:glycosyltransferase involved in cell wall biosynthesis